MEKRTIQVYASDAKKLKAIKRSKKFPTMADLVQKILLDSIEHSLLFDTPEDKQMLQNIESRQEGQIEPDVPPSPNEAAPEPIDNGEKQVIDSNQ